MTLLQAAPLPTRSVPLRRVLFIDHTAKMSGGEVALLNLVTQLDRGRYEPAVLLFENGPLREKLLAAGIRVHLMVLDHSVQAARKDALGVGSALRLGAVSRLMSFVWKVRRFIRSRDFDLIHTNSLKADVIGGLAAYGLGKPVIWHVRDRIDRDYLPAKVVAVFRRLCRVLPTVVLANSAATLETLHLTGSTVEGQTVYSGVDASRPFRRSRVVHDGLPTGPQMSPGDSLSGEAGPGDSVTGDSVAGMASGHTRRVAMVGRLSRWKGQHVFVSAAEQVRARFPDATFLIVGAALFGEKEYEQQLHDQVQTSDLHDAVEFTGFREDVPALMASVDVLVHASITAEPFGQVIIEAMAAGRPVVATAAGGPLEIVDDGVTGILVPMADAPAMADAICRLLAAPELAARMGVAGRQRVLDRFTIERTVADVQQVYDTLVQSPV